MQQYLCKIDLESGYNQVEIHLDHHRKTVFQTIFDLSEYLVMQLSLSNEPNIF